MYSETETDIRVFRRFLRRPSRRRLERVVRTYHAPLWRIAVTVSGNEDDAHDIVQDVFLSLILNPPGPEGVRSPLGFLVYRAVSRARHMDRAAARRRARETEAVRRIAAAGDMAEADLEEVRETVQALPEPLRTTVELHYLGGLRNAAIAATLAVSERTVERNLQHARHRLRAALGRSALSTLLSIASWQAAIAAPSPPLAIFRALGAGRAVGPASAATSSRPSATSIFGIETAKSKTALAIGIASVLLVGLSLGLMSLSGERPPPEDGSAGSGARLAAVNPAVPQNVVPAADPASAETASLPSPAPASVSPRLMKDRYLLTGRIVEATAPRDPAAGVHPVIGARVDFKPHPRRADPQRAPEPQRVVTGPDGTFAFGAIPWGVWLRLEIDAPERALLTLSFKLDDPEGEGRIELGDIRVEDGIDLLVDVSGPDGETVNDAGVMVKRTVDPRLQAAGMYESHRQATSEGDGRYRLERMAPGTLQVTVMAPGYSRFRQQVAFAEDGHASVRLARGQVIRGVVTATDGRPLPGAELQIKGPGLVYPIPTTRSDDAGRFVFDLLSAGEYQIRARAGGYVELKKHGLTPDGGLIAFALEPESVYRGRVTSSSGAPVEKARVTLAVPGWKVDALTDSDGRFTAGGLAAGDYYLTVDHEDHAPLYAGLVQIESRREISGLELRLEPGVSESGTVRDSATGRGIEGAWITLSPLGSPAEAARVKRMAKTSESGDFSVRGLCPGSYSLTIKAPGYIGGHRTLVVEGQPRSDVQIELTAGSSIGGAIADQHGRPIAGADVFLSLSPAFAVPPARAEPSRQGVGGADGGAPSSRAAEPPARTHKISAQSDADGAYVLEAVPPWDGYMITVTHRDHAFAFIDGVGVGINESVGGVDFVLLPGGTIEGQVIAEDGHPLAGVDVRYALERAGEDGRTLLVALEDRSRPGNDSRERFITLSDGTFSIPRLPEGNYTLTAQVEDFLPTTVRAVVVRDGRSTAGLRLVIRPGETLSGHVVSGDGEPVAGAVVLTARRDPCVCAEFPAEVTGDDGRFLFRGLSPGAARLTIKKPGFMTVTTTVELPAAGQVFISILSAGRARGVLMTPVPVDYASVEIRAVDLESQLGGKPFPAGEVVRPDSNGEFSIDLAPGSYRLVAAARDLAPGRSEAFSISVGDELMGIDIPLTAGGHLRGVVVARASGQAVEGARIQLEPVDPTLGAALEATSGASGEFAFERIAEGGYRLVAEHAHHSRTIADVIVVEGENPPAEIALTGPPEDSRPKTED